MTQEHRRIDDLYKIQRDFQRSMSNYVRDLNENVSKLNESVALMVQSQEYSQKSLNLLSERLSDVESEQKKIALEHDRNKAALKKVEEIEQIAFNASKYIEDQAEKSTKKRKIYWRIFDVFLRWSIPLMAGVFAATFVKLWDEILKIIGA